MNKHRTLTIVVLLLIGFVMTTFASSSQAQQFEFGCCQYFVDEKPRCIYPISSKGCTEEGQTYINDGLCDSESGYCSGYKELKSKSTKEDKE